MVVKVSQKTGMESIKCSNQEIKDGEHFKNIGGETVISERAKEETIEKMNNARRVY